MADWNKILKIWKNYKKSLRILEETLEKDVFKLRVGDELQQGVMKLAKVYIAQKERFLLEIRWLVDMVTRDCIYSCS